MNVSLLLLLLFKLISNHYYYFFCKIALLMMFIHRYTSIININLIHSSYIYVYYIYSFIKRNIINDNHNSFVAS